MYSDEKNISDMFSVFTGWLTSILNLVVGTVLLPLNLVLGLLTGDVITLSGVHHLDG